MAKNFVLAALRLLGLEEMLKLSQVLRVKQNSFKKAAGEELVVWDEASEPLAAQAPGPRIEGKILKFTKEPSAETEASYQAEHIVPEQAKDAEPGLIVSAEFMLWQREMSKESAPAKQDAVKGYSRSNEMYAVKSNEKEGTGKIRFASTHGVLVNKKQG